MMTRYKIAATAAFCLLASAHLALGASSQSPAPAQEGWSKKMQSLYKTLSALMTDISSDARFEDPKNRGKIVSNAKLLSELAHDLKTKKVASPDKDPSISLFSNLFADETGRAYRALKSGNATYGRALLKSIPGYCIACHTRNQSGPAFTSLPLEPQSDGLTHLERGEFFASTRQYDRALKELDLVIANSTAAKMRPIEWSQAVKYSLAIAVRVKQDPALARQIAERVTSSKNTPFFMKVDTKRWLASIDKWDKEPRHTPTNEEGLYAEAVRLLGEARTAQEYPADHAGDIQYLRASAAVHNLLQLGPQTRHAGEAYLMAGLCYETLSSFRIGDVHEIYYEACVRTSPHTMISTACFRRYQEAIFFGYTGSRGTDVPEDVRLKLRELEELASPVEPNKAT